MGKIKTLEIALNIFKIEANNQAECSETGDYKSGNKSYQKIIDSVNFIKDNNFIDSLISFLSDESIGVRLWSAYFLLPENESHSLQILEQIEQENSIHSLTAKTTISEWKKGNLKL